MRFSGLNKTLFASVGPNSHWRGHRQSTILDVINYLQTKKDISLPGRMKSRRGHRLDGTFVSRFVSLVSPKLLNAANIPPYIYFVVSRCVVILASIFLPLRSSSKIMAEVVKNAVAQQQC